MIYLVGLLSLVFLVLALLVVSRLTSVLKGVDTSGTTVKPEIGMSNRVNGMLFLAFLIFGTLAAGWSFIESSKHFLPEASSIHGKNTDFLFWLGMGIITVAFFITNALLFGFAWKYQYKPGYKAAYYPENHKLELIWTVIPAVVMAVLVFTGWREWVTIMAEAPKDARVVELVGKQFNWIARYPGVDNKKLGAFNYKLIDNNNDTGIDFSDAASFDDFTSTTELHVPVNVPILLKIRARDVLHSVFIPHLRVKMDAVPGMPTRFQFTATKTTEEMRNMLNNQNFNYEIACTEVCGRGHFSMRLRLVIEDEASYNKWCAEQKPLLTAFPEYAARIPDNLKAKAAKYLPAPTAAADSTIASATGGAAPVSVSFR